MIKNSKKIVGTAISIMMLAMTSLPVFAEQESTQLKVIENTQTVYVSDNVSYELDAPSTTRGAEVGYISTLDLAANAVHTGALRDYKYDYYKITMTPTSFKGGFVNGRDTAHIKVAVQSKGWTGYTVLGDTDLYYSFTGTTQTGDLGKCGAGSRAYGFRTYSYGVIADPVVMESSKE